MATKLKIPERFRAGVSAIRSLDEPSVQAIKEALDVTARKEPDDLSVVAREGEIVNAAITSVPSVTPQNFGLVSSAVAALYAVRSSRELPIDEFADEVCDALESVPEEELRLHPAEREAFKKKLITLLGAEVFNVITKVGDLTVEHERTFCHARIVTDLRPIFGSNVADGPRAMLVVHNLRVAYHEGSKEHKDFYVTLDADDLRTLRQLIQRAEDKAQALKSVTKFPLLGLAKEEN